MNKTLFLIFFGLYLVNITPSVEFTMFCDSLSLFNLVIEGFWVLVDFVKHFGWFKGFFFPILCPKLSISSLEIAHYLSSVLPLGQSLLLNDSSSSPSSLVLVWIHFLPLLTLQSLFDNPLSLGKYLRLLSNSPKSFGTKFLNPSPKAGVVSSVSKPWILFSCQVNLHVCH